MTSWPAGLPQRPLREGARFVRASNVIRTTFEAGVAKQRRRYSAVAEEADLQMLMTQAELATFLTWYRDTLGEAGTFTWRDWRDPAEPPATWRFRAPPQITPLGGPWWQVSLPLEILP
ncbi:MAG: hypothetical protein KatS3mg119_1881 [Rhodothalassiaceae bacterium]|nr:MAG: hypothetical protein KatS3mg119_1881 [Rhodothalassiaceae bacterium]